MFLLVSPREEFIALWRSALMRTGGPVLSYHGLAAASAAHLESPQLMVVDVALLPAGWHPASGDLKELAGTGRILLGGGDFAVDAELAALAAGVSGCCATSLGPDELHNVVEVVLKGGIWVSRGALPLLLGRLQGLVARETLPVSGAPAGGEDFERAWGQLTAREKEIARQVADGASNKVIARRLAISDATIKAHLTSVFQKLHVAGRLQLGLLLSARTQKPG
jgi:DNA-binding NarL/FixJ family response regulator